MSLRGVTPESPLFISPSCPAAFWACSFAVAMASHPALHLGQQVTQVDGRTGALSVVFVCAIRHDGFVQTGLSCSASSCYGPTPCQLRSPSMSVICSYLPGFSDSDCSIWRLFVSPWFVQPAPFSAASCSAVLRQERRDTHILGTPI